MTVEELIAEASKLSAEDRARLLEHLEAAHLEAAVGKRLDEARADPSIMIPYEEVRAHGRAIIEKHRASRVSSGS